MPDCLITRSAKTPASSNTMDEFEGRRYRRIPVKLRRLDGTEVKEQVLTYVGKDADRDSKIKTSWNYVKHYFVGMKEHGIPSEYVEYVRQAILSNDPSLAAELKKHVPTSG